MSTLKVTREFNGHPYSVDLGEQPNRDRLRHVWASALIDGPRTQQELRRVMAASEGVSEELGWAVHATVFSTLFHTEPRLAEFTFALRGYERPRGEPVVYFLTEPGRQWLADAGVTR